ncbi:hypothetical protein ON010_g12412 [Phytophthora cinnamomi]|nr:hypothetical protein ON010_g12412 [Phytophthora cinnamomi]
MWRWFVLLREVTVSQSVIDEVKRIISDSEITKYVVELFVDGWRTLKGIMLMCYRAAVTLQRRRQGVARAGPRRTAGAGGRAGRRPHFLHVCENRLASGRAGQQGSGGSARAVLPGAGPQVSGVFAHHAALQVFTRAAKPRPSQPTSRRAGRTQRATASHLAASPRSARSSAASGSCAWWTESRAWRAYRGRGREENNGTASYQPATDRVPERSIALWTATFHVRATWDGCAGVDLSVVLASANRAPPLSVVIHSRDQHGSQAARAGAGRRRHDRPQLRKVPHRPRPGGGRADGSTESENVMCQSESDFGRFVPLRSAPHKQAFADERVTFVQADLTRDAHVDRAFNPEFGPYDFVFNLAGETKCGLSETVYASKCRDLSVKCVAGEAAGKGGRGAAAVDAAGQVQARGGGADPQSAGPQGRLPPVGNGISRVAVVVYGSADSMGLMPRIVCAASYVKLEEKMKLLWDAEMRVNTVHVFDVCQALWHVTTAGSDGEIYNLVDKNDTNQAKINAVLEEIFHIKTGFIGKLVSNLARVRLADVVDDANEKHMQPWADLCSVRATYASNSRAFTDRRHQCPPLSVASLVWYSGTRHYQHAADALHRQGAAAAQPPLRGRLQDRVHGLPIRAPDFGDEGGARRAGRDGAAEDLPAYLVLSSMAGGSGDVNRAIDAVTMRRVGSCPPATLDTF